MNKVEQLRILLIEWADDRFIPLKNEIKSLKRENSILKSKLQNTVQDDEVMRLSSELEFQKNRYKQCDFERLRYRDMASNYSKELRIKRGENNRLKHQIDSLKRSLGENNRLKHQIDSLKRSLYEKNNI